MAKLFLFRVDLLTGSIDDTPFIIQRDKNGQFYTRRIIPYRGGMDSSHWDFLKHLPMLVDSRLYLSDFEVSVDELAEALSEKYACPFLPSQIKKWTKIERLNAAQFRDFDAWLEARGL